MSGKKIEQARDALKFVLDNLRDDDTFNIVAYDDRVESFKPELQRYDRETRKDAARFVENLYPGGSTNIDQALGTALEMIRDRDRPSYVLFLTDGLPTAGETKETAIAAHAREANREHARIFSFGVGYDVNARLLDRLSGTNSGTTVYVKPDENIESHVARFYSKLTSPVLANLEITFNGTDVNRTYPRDLPDLFEGGQLLWVGRYRDSGRSRVEIRGKVGDDRQRITVEADLARPGEGHRNAFVETLWASRRVGDLIDQIDLHGPSSELTSELVDLSRKYGILTPYTSFLAEEPTQLHAQAANSLRARVELDQLSTVAGASGVNQRHYKKLYQDADRPQVLERAAGIETRSETLARLSGKPQSNAKALSGPAQAGQSAPLSEPGLIVSSPAPAANAQAVAAQDAEGEVRVVETVRRVGQKTFFRKNDRWVDSSVTPEMEAKAITIEQFSDRYFDLARSQSAELNQYLTFEEPVTVNLAGQVYKINRPAR
ncbi:MAG TPA: VWA domain-containing protein, partial [Isosphaeraceae bacterium]|nr:VWA domain-containing protein [Isosphaeraceae bacterium]